MMTNTSGFYEFITANVTIAINGTQGPEDTEITQISTTIKDVIMKSFYITISIVGAFGNAVVLVVLFSLTTMRKKLTSIFIINQSIADALTAVILLLTTLLPADDRVYRTVADDLYCRLWVSRLPLWLLMDCSTYNLVALTLERYLSVVHPIRHKMSFSRKKALAIISVTWLVPALYEVGSQMPTANIAEGSCQVYDFPSVDAMRAKGIMGVFLNYFIPIFALIYCYARIACVLKTKVTSENNSGHVSSTQSDQNSRKKRARRNVIKTLMIVSSVFIFCYSWNQWLFFLFNLGVFDFTVLNTNFYHFSVIVMFANCCVNPFIYTAQYEEFQRGLKAILRRNVIGAADTSCADSSVTQTDTLQPDAGRTSCCR